ncbi:hypothetical protein SAMN02745127_00169 [Oceanospirillum multiglobuliferum]|uniref:DUF721 domain-containing protein n=1 Tax=Oceanospirillum multiglobuliferum TaxID=64969 RepID=A0A1T4KQH4_9GAMM|nr:hypothetical protein BTE48_06060 [Oceanospirillum multiglobuliferum]SJZ44650.1 hypothetical protein SAMN02745127_00169 [Oceanospirillum multiglobuliferum]
MRSYRSTKRLSEIIHTDSSLLGKLFHKAEILQSIQKQIAYLLPEPLQHKFQLANISRKEIVIHVHSAALLSRFRLCQNQVMQLINSQYSWAKIEKVVLKVRPHRDQNTSIAKPHRIKSTAIAETVLSCAQSCHDTELKNALLSLAKHIAPEHL